MHSWASMLMFVGMVIGIYLGIQYYLAFWVIRNFPKLPVKPVWVRCGVLFVAASFPFSLFLVGRYPNLLTEGFAFACCVWLGVSFIWLTLAFLSEIAWIMAWMADSHKRVRSRIAWTVVGLTAALSFYAFWNAQRPPRENPVEVSLPNLPKDLDGFKIALVSDLHLGVTTSMRRLDRTISLIEGMDPDIVIFSGDILDRGFRKPDWAATTARNIRARHGKFAVLGNHEFYHGLKSSIAWHEKAGFRLLRNETAELPGGLQLAGVDDLRTARIPDELLSLMLSKIDPERPSILVSHQPRAFNTAAERGVGLTLSGHTHGGQIFPFHILVKMSNDYLKGIYRKGESTLYVTPGTGHWGPPMRLLTRTEVTRITLRPEISSQNQQ